MSTHADSPNRAPKQHSIQHSLHVLTPDLLEDTLFGHNGGYRDGRAEALLLAHYARAIEAAD